MGRGTCIKAVHGVLKICFAACMCASTPRSIDRAYAITHAPHACMHAGKRETGIKYIRLSPKSTNTKHACRSIEAMQYNPMQRPLTSHSVDQCNCELRYRNNNIERASAW